jgi:hypothetical protein|eukprot:COSAG03_NODE_178_length_11063_cov_43.316951_11_plen_459_part_00
MERARQDGKLLDVTLVISSGRRLRAHKLVLLTHSPYLDGLLTSGFAESAAGFDELTVQGDSGAIEAIVDCMYTGKLVLSPETVQAIIRVANMLGVGTAEQAACQYFVGQLSTHTVIDALGFAAQLVESGAHGRWLYQQCLSYSRTHFEDCRGSFQRLSCETLCELIRSDDLRVRSEESVLETVRSWVLDDLHSRQSSLPQLAVLIRFPRLPTAAQLSLANEPVIQHLLAAQSALVPQLLTECLPAFAKTPAADDCPRLQARLPLQSSWRATWSSAMKDKSITLSADLLGALNNVPLDEDDEDFDGSGEMVWSDRPLPNHGVVYWELAFTGENLSDGDELGSGYVVGVSNAEYFAANPNPNLFATGKGVWGWTDDRGCVEDGVVDDDIVTERPYHCYRANDRVGVLADMGAKRLQFYKNGQKMEGVVVRGFPEDVRIVTTPYNRGVTATLSFPLGPAQD